MIMSIIMSRKPDNITAPVRLRFAVLSGAWDEWEESDEMGCAWEFTPTPTEEAVLLDAWEVRKEFSELRHDRDALQNFLRKTGAFCWIDQYRPITESELWKFQAAIRQQLLNPTVSENRIKLATDGILPFDPTDERAMEEASRKAWSAMTFEWVIHNRIQAHVMNINIGFEDGTLVGEAEARNTFDAILSTIFIDRLKKLRFKVCKRPDCAAIYELTSRHKRQFCSYECAHLMAVRRSRTRSDANHNKKKTLIRSRHGR
jgi:hypothetical protein